MTKILSDRRVALTAARERLEQARAAVERGLTARNAANDRRATLNDDDARRAAEYAGRVEQAAITGDVATPYFELPAPDAAERHCADIEVRGAHQALERLNAAQDQAHAEVTAAEQALCAAVDQVLDARARELMKQAETHLRGLQQIGADLQTLLRDDRFDSGPSLMAEPAMRELLKRLPTTPRDELHVPVRELQFGGPRLSRLPELRAELMAGEPEQTVQAAA